MSKALQSLTAQYTDSENEGEVEEDSPDSSNSQASQVKQETVYAKFVCVGFMLIFSHPIGYYSKTTKSKGRKNRKFA